jgi:hypothetical protein
MGYLFRVIKNLLGFFPLAVGKKISLKKKEQDTPRGILL